jgi:hypothetical protein
MPNIYIYMCLIYIYMCLYIYMKCWWFLGQTVNLPGYTRKFWVWTVSWAAVRSFESPQGGRLLLPRLLCHCHCAAPNGGLRAKRPVERWNGGTSAIRVEVVTHPRNLFNAIIWWWKSCLFIKSGFRPYPFAVSKWECKSRLGTKPSTNSWWRWWLPEAGWSTEADCAAPFAQLGPWRLKTLASLLVPWRFPYGNPGVSWRRTSPDSTRIEWFHINIAINIINWSRPPV